MWLMFILQQPWSTSETSLYMRSHLWTFSMLQWLDGWIVWVFSQCLVGQRWRWRLCMIHSINVICLSSIKGQRYNSHSWTNFVDNLCNLKYCLRLGLNIASVIAFEPCGIDWLALVPHKSLVGWTLCDNSYTVNWFSAYSKVVTIILKLGSLIIEKVSLLQQRVFSSTNNQRWKAVPYPQWCGSEVSCIYLYSFFVSAKRNWL